MKKDRISVFACVLFALALLLGSCQKEELKPEPDGNEIDMYENFTGLVYNYEAFQDPDIWKQFNNFQQRIDATQIPEDVLKKLSVEGLSQSCLFYPLRSTYFAYDYPYSAIHYMIDWNNGLTKLVDMKDAPRAMVKLYKNMDLSKDNHKYKGQPANIQDLNDFMTKGYLELLLSTEYFVPKLDAEALFILINTFYDKLNYQINHSDFYSYAGSLCHSYCMAARIALSFGDMTEEETDTVNTFLKFAGMAQILGPQFVTEATRIICEQVDKIEATLRKAS